MLEAERFATALSSRRILLPGQFRDRVLLHAERGPFIHWLRAQAQVEINRWLIPIQHGPFEPSAFPLFCDSRHAGKKSLADALPSQFRLHKKIFEIHSCSTQECREVMEKHRISRWFFIPIGE